jgi:hypothetical protein
MHIAALGKLWRHEGDKAVLAVCECEECTVQRTPLCNDSLQAFVYGFCIGPLAEEDGVYLKVTPAQDQRRSQVVLWRRRLQMDGQQERVRDPGLFFGCPMDEDGVVCCQMEVDESRRLVACLEHHARDLMCGVRGRQAGRQHGAPTLCSLMPESIASSMDAAAVQCSRGEADAADARDEVQEASAALFPTNCASNSDQTSALDNHGRDAAQHHAVHPEPRHKDQQRW